MPTDEEAARHKRDYWWSPPKWDYQSTGMLRISLHSSETTGARRTRSEREERSLETYLGAVVLGVGTLVESIKKVKAERQRLHDEFEAEQKRRREELGYSWLQKRWFLVKKGFFRWWNRVVY